MRICKKCGETKELAAYRRENRNKDGLAGTCRSCESAYKRAWATAHADEVQESKRRHYEANKEKIIARAAQWKKNNPQAVVESGARRYAKNRTRILDHNKAWLKSNLLKARAACHRRRARINNAIGSYEEADIKRLFLLQRKRCACCGKLLASYHIDHVIPLAKGGSNSKENLQLLCGKCNHEKHSKDPIVFMQSRGFLL